MAKVAHLGPLAAILVNFLQDLSMSSTSKNVPLDELFQLRQSWRWVGGGVLPQTDRPPDNWTVHIAEWHVGVAPCEQQGTTKNQQKARLQKTDSS